MGSDLGFDELYGDFGIDFCVRGLVDFAHPPFAQFFDDLVSSRKGRACCEFFPGRFDGFSYGGQGFIDTCKRSGALPAEFRVGPIICITLRAFHMPVPLGLRK